VDYAADVLNVVIGFMFATMGDGTEHMQGSALTFSPGK
jgi:hypothetical protein